MALQVRGTVPQAADKITDQINKGEKTFPFEKVTFSATTNEILFLSFSEASEFWQV